MYFRVVENNQAMKTAMKANMKISKAPPIGKTMGIKGTIDSTTSVEFSAGLCSDMVTPWVHYSFVF